MKPSVAVNLDAIPAELRQRSQWVVWKYIDRDGKPTKCPFTPATLQAARSDRPDTWGSFEDAAETWRREGFAGVGYVFSEADPYCGVDLDDCINEQGSVVEAAQEIILALNSYAEVSPSGRGVKIFAEARKPGWAKCRSKQIPGFKETEVYDRERFFTCTGSRLAGTPSSVEPRQSELEALCRRLWPTQPGTPPLAAAGAGFAGEDDDLIAVASSAKNGALFRALWSGDTSGHCGDDSAADLALCNLLAFWTGNDPRRMDGLFRRSGLFRAKWDKHRGDRTYGQHTIAKAVDGCREVYSGVSGETADGTGGLVPLGQSDPSSGRLVLSPKRTLPTADAYLREFNTHPDGPTLHNYGGLLLEWRNNRYCEVEVDAVKQRLVPWLHRALRYNVNRKTGEMELVDFDSNPATVAQALETISSVVHLPGATAMPSWLCGSEGRPPANEVLPCRSFNLHVPTREVLPATPALFTSNALDFDYEPHPEPPERWVKFLEQVFGEDLEAVQLLQEWTGYCLVGDTSHQKMLLLVGPRRSGKGTIARVLTKLVGEGNVTGPTTAGLAESFGLQPLIGKSLAIVSDARFGGDGVSTVVERLLCISGEDTLTINRKFLSPVTMRLPTRFMFLTNELPRLQDASTALAGRFLVVPLRRSFYGREDTTLTGTLLAELPGILSWALDGLTRLRARGCFVQPQSGAEAIQEMEDLASPVGAFVRERCHLDPAHRVSVDDLYAAWKSWCEQDGRNSVSTKQAFGRDLTAVAPGVARRRGTGLISFYQGIRLKEGPV